MSLVVPAEIRVIWDEETGERKMSPIYDIRLFNELSVTVVGKDAGDATKGAATQITFYGLRKGGTAWEKINMRWVNDTRPHEPATYYRSENIRSLPVATYCWDNIPSVFAYFRMSYNVALPEGQTITAYICGRTGCPAMLIPVLGAPAVEELPTTDYATDVIPTTPTSADWITPNGVEPTCCATFSWSSPPGQQYDPVGWMLGGSWEMDINTDIPNGVWLINNGISTRSASSTITGYGNPSYPTVFSWKLGLCVVDIAGVQIDGKLHVTTDISDEIIDCPAAGGYQLVTYYSMAPIGPFNVTALQDDGLAWPCVHSICMGGDPGLRT